MCPGTGINPNAGLDRPALGGRAAATYADLNVERAKRSTSMTHRLAEMAWPDVAKAVASGITTVILPLGATEQHGPHLPLGTDTIRAEALADRLSERLSCSLVAPALPFGCSDEHAGFAGLIGLEAETLAAVILDCARRVSGWGARRLILLSAHGGNGRALPLAVELIERELPDLAVWAPENLGSIAKSILEVALEDGVSPEALGIHAGEGETSEMLHLRPELVRSGAAAPGYTGDMEAVLEKLHAGGLKPVTKGGVLGDPARAEANRGERYLDALADEIAAELRSESDEG